jgi:hypothetical protein
MELEVRGGNPTDAELAALLAVLQRALAAAPVPPAAPLRAPGWRLRHDWAGRSDWRRPRGITGAPRSLC